MRRALLSWLVAFALLAAGFGASVLALNTELYSAPGFVRGYLDALARGDAEAALATEGVSLPEGTSATLLTASTLPDDYRVVSDTTEGDTHAVTVAIDLGSGTEQAVFHVERTGTRFGLFPTWRFAATPLATLAVSVPGDARFRANGVDAIAGELAVFAPGRYELDHGSDLLTAPAVDVDVVAPGSRTEAVVEVSPTEVFEERAAEAVAGFLGECAAQAVLQPAGCPFGFTEPNRIEGSPTWSITDPPQLSLVRTDTAGVWRATGTGGTAHLAAQVRSLFDGSVRTLDEAVPLSGDYLVAIAADGSLTVGGA